MKKASLITDKSGFSLIEAMLAIALLAVFSTIFVGAYLYGLESTALAGKRARAVFLAEEGVEAARNIRDSDFALLVDGTYGLSTSGGSYGFSGSSDTTDIFTREITIASVDADRKAITSSVSWQQNAQRTGQVSLVTRLTNWLVEVTGDWTSPFEEASVDLSGSNNALKVDISGNYAYVVRSGGTDFAVIDISTPSSPSLVTSLAISGTPSNIFIDGSYAYVTSNSNSAELTIVDISTPTSPSITATFNNPSNRNALGVYVVGSYAYMTLQGGNEFSIVDVTLPAVPVLASTLNLPSRANEVVVSGNYAFVTSHNNSQEVMVVDVTNPLLPSHSVSLNLSGSSNAIPIALNGSYLLVGQGSTFHVVDVSTPTSPTLSGSVSLAGTINDIALNLSGDHAFIASSDNSEEFQVVDVSDPATPTFVNSVDVSSAANLNGVAYDGTLDRVVGAGSSNSQEVLVFSPL